MAQLRIVAELQSLLNNSLATPSIRLFLTDTLGNPYAEEEYIPQIHAPIGESRRRANRIKQQEKITVVIGNPPYGEKARGRGGWIERRPKESGETSLLDQWKPPPEWNVGQHAKHLRNLYVYFWRWATWKVFGAGDPSRTEGRGQDRRGIVSFITAAGFLNGPGFEKMRAELRRHTDEIWIIDCSPEGHQPEVATRIFQGVQQPVCIVMALRSTNRGSASSARVRYRVLPLGRREKKFTALGSITLDDDGWAECSAASRASFLPRATGVWADFTPIEDLFIYNGSGVMPGRTWVIAPDRASLERRWDVLQSEGDPAKKETLFHPHLRNGEPGDKHVNKRLRRGIYGHEFRAGPVASDKRALVRPTRYGYRSFDRQWIIPDARVINQPNPTLWENHTDQQVYMTALHRSSPTAGPAVTFSAEIPDLDHYKGSFGGRVFPLWADRRQSRPNLKGGVLRELACALSISVGAADLMAYLAAVAAHPDYTARFQPDLVQPGIRVPVTADKLLFLEAVKIGREVIWLHCFGERLADAGAGRPASRPRMPEGKSPVVPKGGAIPSSSGRFPDRIEYAAASRRLHIGDGFIDNVPEGVWEYEVSGKQVLVQWFSYRRGDRSRPIIGNRRPPSPLGKLQPDGWLAEYTTELLNVLHVLGRLVALEPRQTDLLNRICDGSLLSADNLRATGAFETAHAGRGGRADQDQRDMLDEAEDR